MGRGKKNWQRRPAIEESRRPMYQTGRDSGNGGATPGCARSNDLAEKSTALAPPCLLLCFGNIVNRK